MVHAARCWLFGSSSPSTFPGLPCSHPRPALCPRTFSGTAGTGTPDWKWTGTRPSVAAVSQQARRWWGSASLAGDERCPGAWREAPGGPGPQQWLPTHCLLSLPHPCFLRPPPKCTWRTQGLVSALLPWALERRQGMRKEVIKQRKLSAVTTATSFL